MAVNRPAVKDLELEVIQQALCDTRGTAFDRFCRYYDPTVRWAVGNRVLRWPRLVPSFEDIVQDVWIRLLRQRTKPLLGYDPARGLPFASFLALISGRYGWRLAQRRLQPEVGAIHDDLDDEGWDFTIELMQADVLDRLAARVDAMDERSRHFFYGHFVQGRQIREVGAELGLTDNTSHAFKLRFEKKLVAIAKQMFGLDSAPSHGGMEGSVALILAVYVALSIGDRACEQVSSERLTGLVGRHD